MIKRPLLNYLGSKWRIAQHVISHFPEHKIYVEPYGGGASVLLTKPPANLEIYNDINDDLVNLFSVLRDKPSELIKALRRTPYSESEFNASFEHSDDPLERARRLVVRSHMAFHSCAVFGGKTSFCLYGQRFSSEAKRFANYVRAIQPTINRLRHVTITCRPATAVIEQFNSPDVLIYADPPYVSETRRTYTKYGFEMDDKDHRDMLDLFLGSKCMIILSGYPSDIYDDRLKDWRRVSIENQTFATGQNRTKTEEVLWINPEAQSKLSKSFDRQQVLL